MFADLVGYFSCCDFGATVVSKQKRRLADWRLPVCAWVFALPLNGCSSAPNLGDLINSVQDFSTPIVFKIGPNQYREAIIAESMSQNKYDFIPSNPCTDNVVGTIEGINRDSGTNNVSDSFAKSIVNWLITDGYLAIKRFSVRYNYQGQEKPAVNFKCTTFSGKLHELKAVDNNNDPSISDSFSIVMGHRVITNVVFGNSYEITVPVKYTVYRGSFSYQIDSDIAPVKFQGEGHGEIEVFKDPRTTRWTLVSFSLADPNPEIDRTVPIDDTGGDCPGTSTEIVALAPLAHGELAALGLAKKASVAIPIEFSDINGKRLSVADFKGHTLLLNFWATSCVPCRTELVKLDHLQAKAALQNSRF